MTWTFFVVVYFMSLSSSTKEYLSLFAQEPKQWAPSPGLPCCRDGVTKCYIMGNCPSFCFVGQYCKPQLHQGHKDMTNLKHMLIPAARNTLSGVNLPIINFMLSVVFEGICRRADNAQTLPINEQVCWKNTNTPCFVLWDTKRLQKMSLIFKIWFLVKRLSCHTSATLKCPALFKKK